MRIGVGSLQFQATILSADVVRVRPALHLGEQILLVLRHKLEPEAADGAAELLRPPRKPDDDATRVGE